MKKLLMFAMTLPLLLSSCAVGPNYKRPSFATPAAFKEAAALKDFVGPMQPATEIAEQLKPAKPMDDSARGKWWEVFNDAELNKLEEQVAVSNQTVKAAEASFRQARSLVAEARASFFPTADIDGSFTRSGSGGGNGNSATTLGTGSTITTVGGGVRNNYSASLQGSWVPDFWGKIRRQFEASKAGAQASAADLASAILSAQGELAIDYMSLRIADEQKRLLDRTAAAYAKSLEITQNQYKTGVAANSDVLQAKVQLETTEAQAMDVGVARAQFEHAIAVLVGKAPADFNIAIDETVPLLPEIPEAIPAPLLQRRPDIAAAERNVAQANAQIGVAEAAYFPDITLSAAGGYASSMLYQWFVMPNRFWSIGPSLVETVFDAGLRSAQTEAAIANYDQTVATYRQTVLVAFQGVEDNLAGLRILGHEAGILDAAVKDARASTTVALNQYKAGTVSYLNVITAQAAQLNSELTALNVRKLRLTAAATLIEDLGGGWSDKELSKHDVTHGETGILSILPPSIHQDR